MTWLKISLLHLPGLDVFLMFCKNCSDSERGFGKIPLNLDGEVIEEHIKYIGYTLNMMTELLEGRVTKEIGL